MFSWTKFFSFLARLGDTLLDLVEKRNWSKKNVDRQKEIDKVDDWVNNDPNTINANNLRLRGKIKAHNADES